MNRSIFHGAACGGATWLVYGTIEAVLCVSIQLWRFPEMDVPGWQWTLIAQLMGIYVVAGFILGGAGSLLLNWQKSAPTPARNQILASLTLTLAFGANLISAWPLARSEYIALIITFLLAGTLAAGLLSDRYGQLGFLASPWTVSLLLLAAPWVSRDALDGLTSPFLKMALSMLSLVIVLAGASVWHRVRPRQGTRVLAQAALATSIFGIFLTAVALAGRQPAMPADSTPPAGALNYPNILLITMDTVRADHTSVYGYHRDTTPALREFARGATVYSRATATSDFTLPTHAALFTGLYPNWSGALAALEPRPGNIADPLRPDTVTLAEILRAKGYRTAEVAANFGFLGDWTGLTRGFAVADLRRPVSLSTGDRPFYLRAAARRVLSLMINTARLDRPSFNAWDINTRALKLLNAMKPGGAPFFLFLNYMDAHTPYVPDPPYDTRFPGLDSHVNPYELHDLKLQVASGKRRILPNEKAHLIAQYDGGIAEEDAAIGLVLNRLRELKLYDNTLIVITSDHGDTFGEHGLADHFLGFVYQDLVHIPLLIKYPRQQAPASSDELVSQVDFLPTVLDLLGAKANSGLQGRSLLRPVPGEGVAVFSQGTRSGLVGVGNPRFDGLRRAIFAGSLKLISWTAGAPEMYDVAADPTESLNLYRPDEPRAVELSERLRSWVSAMPARKAPTKMNKSTLERLKSLGYTQ